MKVMMTMMMSINDWKKIRVKIGGEFSEPGSIGREVRQGCPLSPILFNLYIEELVREEWSHWTFGPAGRQIT